MGLRKNLGRVQLRDVVLADLLLLVVGVEDGGAVGRTYIRPLAIELRRVVDHGKEDLQQLAIGDLRRVENNLYRFRMSGILLADLFVGCSGSGAPA